MTETSLKLEHKAREVRSKLRIILKPQNLSMEIIAFQKGKLDIYNAVISKHLACHYPNDHGISLP